MSSRGETGPEISDQENRALQETAATDRFRGAGSIVLTVYLCILIPALSFYMPEGYAALGNYRFDAYRVVTLAFVVPLLVLTVLLWSSLRGQKERDRQRGFALTDFAMLVYLFCLTVSFLLSCDHAESLWGTTGWRMGFLTELLFAAFYFFARLFPPCLRITAFVGGGCAAAVTLIAVLDRFGIYVLPFMGADASFVSTIGNVDWYCGYLALAGSLAAGVWFSLLFGDRQKKNAAGGDADTGFHRHTAARAGAYLLLLLTGISAYTQGAVCGYLILPLIIVAGLSVFSAQSRLGRTVRGVSRGVAVLLILGYFVLLLLFLNPHDVDMWLWERSLPGEWMVSDDFANGRGAIWRISWSLYEELPWIRRLFGIGPDAYAAYAYSSARISGLVVSAFGAARLTNAHSELFTLLIDEGAAGALAWVFVLISAVRPRRSRPSALTLTAIFAIVTVSAVQAFTFRTITATPFLFLLMGAAENERESGKGKAR
ncbi:MAG: O-antigen ligase family protein [Lachnospiraceae bacterium]|nr:O-antigen ligase family protein [Lachnospiraceae bacterium]